MQTVAVEHKFELPIEELWELLGDFGDITKWSGTPPETCIHEGEGIGSIRILTLDDGRKIIDKLEAQDEFSYSYSIVKSPLPYKMYRATMALSRINRTATLFKWTGHFEPLGISEEEAVAYTKEIYRMGIQMMQNTIKNI